MTESKKYIEIIKHYENCFSKHGDNHLGLDWPNMKDLERRYSVMLDIINTESDEVSLLDFGCGTAMLYTFMKQQSKFSNTRYSGVDMGEKLIDCCRNKYPDTSFYCQDLLLNESLPKFDYVIANGVFTEKQNLSYDEMFAYFKKLVKKVFQCSHRGIAFNVMSSHVDWERDDLFHLSTDALISYLSKELSRNFVIRNDYGLYEYTVYLYR